MPQTANRETRAVAAPGFMTAAEAAQDAARVAACWRDGEYANYPEREAERVVDAEPVIDYEAERAAALARVAASDRRAFERATPAQQAALFIICRTHGTDAFEAMCRYVAETVAQEGTCAEHEARMCEVAL